ncbi:MAG: HDOD domain-containing protein [Gemmatimonadaceae bacterium]|jgi:HD-like signal output (HDOD) protein|nr:HDOD domain-containing protein [Gemmatimonadaceae bacterium]
MLPKVLSRWSTQKSTPPAEVASPVADAAPAAAAPPVPALKPTPAVPIFGNQSISDEVEASADVRRHLRTALTELERDLDSGDRRGDAPALFDRLAKSGEKTVRQPPAAAQRALDMMRRPDVPIPDLVRLVEQDPSLAQALLRHANSALYASASGGQVVSLADAIRRVGTQGLRSVVLASMVEGMLCRPGAAFDQMVRQVWEHMVRTAPVARGIAPAFGVVPDEAFTLGLLHDVGKLVLFDRIGTLRADLRRDLQLSAPLVTRMLRALHEPLGGAAALRWGLGKSAAEVIGAHHRRAEPLEPSAHAECIFVAERLDLALVRGQPVDLDGWWAGGRLRTVRELAEPFIARTAALRDGD